jgi:uncharacterized protein (DUF2345 family)
VGQKYSLAVGGGGSGATSGSSLQMDADTVTLKVGKAVLVLNASGDISINGKQITIAAEGDDVVVSGNNVFLN